MQLFEMHGAGKINRTFCTKLVTFCVHLLRLIVLKHVKPYT